MTSALVSMAYRDGQVQDMAKSKKRETYFFKVVPLVVAFCVVES